MPVQPSWWMMWHVLLLFFQQLLQLIHLIQLIIHLLPGASLSHTNVCKSFCDIVFLYCVCYDGLTYCQTSHYVVLSRQAALGLVSSDWLDLWFRSLFAHVDVCDTVGCRRRTGFYVCSVVQIHQRKCGIETKAVSCSGKPATFRGAAYAHVVLSERFQLTCVASKTKANKQTFC